jgi:hypothetical protein
MEKVDDGCYPRLFLKTNSAAMFPAATSPGKTGERRKGGCFNGKGLY